MAIFKNTAFLSLLLFMSVLLLGSYSIMNKRQLELWDDMAEDYFFLAGNLYYKDAFYPVDSVPFVKRPPGYSFFIYAVLEVWGGMPELGRVFKSQQEAEKVTKKSYKAVYFAQCLLLCISTVLFFLWMRNYIGMLYAFFVALLFSCNPYTIILIGLLHYEMLHISLIIISCFFLDKAIYKGEVSWIKLVFAGALFGLTTLVRPITLILPPFILILMLLKYKLSWKPALKWSSIFVIGMALVISPYTIRNYMITDRIVPVNAQKWVVIWGSTVVKFERSANHFVWWQAWYNHGLDLYKKLTDNQEYSYHNRIANIFLMEDGYKREALNNIKNDPGTYLHNVFHNFVTLNMDINSIYIKTFQFIQKRNNKFVKQWLKIGDAQKFHSSKSANSFEWFVNLLSLLALAGIILCIKKRDGFVLVPGLIYLSMCFAHTITFMDLMYYYIKLPFLFLFAGYLIYTIDMKNYKIPVVGWKAAYVIGLLVLLFGIKLTVEVIISS